MPGIEAFSGKMDLDEEIHQAEREEQLLLQAKDDQKEKIPEITQQQRQLDDDYAAMCQIGAQLKEWFEGNKKTKAARMKEVMEKGKQLEDLVAFFESDRKQILTRYDSLPNAQILTTPEELNHDITELRQEIAEAEKVRVLQEENVKLRTELKQKMFIFTKTEKTLANITAMEKALKEHGIHEQNSDGKNGKGECGLFEASNSNQMKASPIDGNPVEANNPRVAISEKTQEEKPTSKFVDSTKTSFEIPNDHQCDSPSPRVTHRRSTTKRFDYGSTFIM